MKGNYAGLISHSVNQFKRRFRRKARLSKPFRSRNGMSRSGIISAIGIGEFNSYRWKK